MVRKAPGCLPEGKLPEIRDNVDRRKTGKGAPLLSLGKWMNRRIERLDWIDMGCIKVGAMLFALLAAKICPGLLALDVRVYVAALVLVLIRPLFRVLVLSGSGRI